MQIQKISDSIHCLRIPFTIPLPDGRMIERFVYTYIIENNDGSLCLIDSGVAGSAFLIFDYLRSRDKDPGKITHLFLTHAHPDHIGAAATIKAQTGCRVAAQEEDRAWIEDPSLQNAQRPVPGFTTLVSGAVTVDRILNHGDRIALDNIHSLEVMHTPGHSAGSVSFFMRPQNILFCGDAIPCPGEAPIFDDYDISIESIESLMSVSGIKWLCESWRDPIQDDGIESRFREGVSMLESFSRAVRKHSFLADKPMERLAAVLQDMGLPLAAANPLAMRSMNSLSGVLSPARA